MSLRVLEINDCGISLSDDSGLLGSSPGYMVAEQRTSVLFGAAAAGSSKLHPLHSSTEFWYRLGMDPLARQLANFRHNADIAHAHLSALVAEADTGGETIVLVPGSYSHQQLAVLLGILKQTPLQVVGLVDSALLAAASQQLPAVYVDLHLHQVLLSQVTPSPVSPPTLSSSGHSQDRMTEALLRREAVVSVPSVGWVGISDTLVQLITEAFIQQCRFNPQHNARWEQTLYDSLPFWLAQEPDADNNLLMEIQTDTVLHQARLTRASVMTRLQPAYRRIIEHLHDLPGGIEGRSLLLSERLAALPGMRAALEPLWQERSGLQQGASAGARLEIISTATLAQTALQYQAQLVTENSAQRLATDLRIAAAAFADPGKTPGPTHILSGAEAWPLQNRLAIGFFEDSERLRFHGPLRAILAEIEVGAELMLRCRESGWSLNGHPLTEDSPLQTGDILQFAGSEPAQLIRVQNGR